MQVKFFQNVKPVHRFVIIDAPFYIFAALLRFSYHDFIAILYACCPPVKHAELLRCTLIFLDWYKQESSTS